MTEKDMAYLAAWFDARGSICVTKRANSTSGLQVQISGSRVGCERSSGLDLLEPWVREIAERVNRHVTQEDTTTVIDDASPDSSRRLRNSDTIILTGKSAYTLLDALLPLLRVKSEQAMACMAAYENRLKVA